MNKKFPQRELTVVLKKANLSGPLSVSEVCQRLNASLDALQSAGADLPFIAFLVFNDATGTIEAHYLRNQNKFRREIVTLEDLRLLHRQLEEVPDE